jgi:hypothetical protein
MMNTSGKGEIAPIFREFACLLRNFAPDFIESASNAHSHACSIKTSAQVELW